MGSVELDSRNLSRLWWCFEIITRLEAEALRDEVRREGPDHGVIAAHFFVIAATLDRNSVLGACQLIL
jgi:hypothetical protein